MSRKHRSAARRISSVQPISGRPTSAGSRPRSKTPAAAAAPHPTQSPLRASDGFTNPLALLGDANPMMSAGTFTRSDLTRNTELLTVLYRESWLAKKIIDLPAEDMTRAWYSLTADLPEEDLNDPRDPSLRPQPRGPERDRGV